MDIPYQRGTPDTWADGVEKLEVQDKTREDGTVFQRIAGPCPRCQHAIHMDIDEEKDGEYFVGIEAGTDAPHPAAAPERIVVICNCTSPHSGAPQGERGCGAEGGVALVADPPKNPGGG